jgi:cytochrome c oxidase subunit IV
VDAQTETVQPASYTEASDGHDTVGHSDIVYVKVFFLLVVLTAGEVTLSYLHIGKAYIPILILLMVIKFGTVVSFFMHLRYERSKIFHWLFYTGLVLATAVFTAVLTTFRIWQS